MIKPLGIQKGETIGIVAVSGPLDEKTLLMGEALLKAHGYEVVIAPSCFEKRGYLAGTSDKRRAEDLMSLFKDPDIKAVLCMRGGYGCNRIMPYLSQFDFSKYPKLFIGFSDVTYLHIYLNQHCGLMTFHGPMIHDLISEDEATNTHFFEMISGNYCFNMKEVPYFNESLQMAEGELVGGNLSIMCSTLGTPYEIQTKGKILFIEEVNEPVYVVDRLLMQLKYSGKLDEANGIILGDFNVFDKEKTKKLLKKTFRAYKKPVAYNIPSGHCLPNYMLPLGSMTRLEPKANQLLFSN